MSLRRPAPAQLPPPGLPGLDPGWSRLVSAADADGVRRTWHVLDSGAAPGHAGTLLCVHGNPTWGYLWRGLLTGAGGSGALGSWRVVAPDHLDMGFSERTGTRRRLARRIEDLRAVTAAMDLPEPVTVVAHDWGGPIGLGWAVANRASLGGIVLTNTAIDQPDTSAAPAVIRLARAPAVLPLAAVGTPAFLQATLALSRHLPAAVRAAYLAPYRSAARRVAIGDFVEDIPLSPSHPSLSALARIRDGLTALGDVPALLLWGPDDPVFGDRYLEDLRQRLPQASIHRFEHARHLVPEDADVAGAVATWLGSDARSAGQPETTPSPASTPASAVGGTSVGGTSVSARERRPLWAALDARSADHATAVAELGGSPPRTVTWARLHAAVRDLAAGLGATGVRPGDRVALLVPPGVDLTAAVYACWRAGAVIVLADAGLGLAGLRRALRSAQPQHIIGAAPGLAAARVLSWPGRRIAVAALPMVQRRALGVTTTLEELTTLGAGSPMPEPPHRDDDAAVLFTSGATGPAKGVVYRHRQLEAQREVLRSTYGITGEDRFVAAFAPFALYGPALGVASAVPDADVTAPRTLTARALADAAAAIGATMVFASPAAVANVVATAAGLDARRRTALADVRLLLSAGAPIPASLLRRAADLLPGAEAHTPYGMTEALPVADIALAGIESAREQAATAEGVCVGLPVAGVQVAVRPLDQQGHPTGARTSAAGSTGELCVRAAHVKDRYDRLWLAEQASADDGWHRTGDVGHLDAHGRVWVEGRTAHVVATARGPVTPVGPEQRVERIAEVGRAAVVGVGPAGTQQVVVVVEPVTPVRRWQLAGRALVDEVRQAAGTEVAAVLLTPGLPVDVRHNAKVDRTAVARRAARLLAGSRR